MICDIEELQVKTEVKRHYPVNSPGYFIYDTFDKFNAIRNEGKEAIVKSYSPNIKFDANHELDVFQQKVKEDYDKTHERINNTLFYKEQTGIKQAIQSVFDSLDTNADFTDLVNIVMEYVPKRYIEDN